MTDKFHVDMYIDVVRYIKICDERRDKMMDVGTKLKKARKNYGLLQDNLASEYTLAQLKATLQGVLLIKNKRS